MLLLGTTRYRSSRQPPHTTDPATRSNLKTSRGRFRNYYRSWIGSNKTSTLQRRTGIPRRPIGARSWQGAHRLMTVIPTPTDGLARAFKEIEEESQKLLAKNALARFADKAKDSSIVARLVERLREAIVSYQVGNCPSAPSVVHTWSRYRNSKQSTARSLISR